MTLLKVWLDFHRCVLWYHKVSREDQKKLVKLNIITTFRHSSKIKISHTKKTSIIRFKIKNVDTKQSTKNQQKKNLFRYFVLNMFKFIIYNQKVFICNDESQILIDQLAMLHTPQLGFLWGDINAKTCVNMRSHLTDGNKHWLILKHGFAVKQIRYTGLWWVHGQIVSQSTSNVKFAICSGYITSWPGILGFLF